MSDYKKALELALTISARDDYDSDKQSDDKCISQALLSAEEMLKEAEIIILNATQIPWEGNMCKKWLVRRKEMIGE